MTAGSAEASSTYASGAFVANAASSEVRWMGQTQTHFLATGTTTNDAFCLVEETAQRGASIPLHRHDEDVESFYVLDGTIRFYLDDQPAAEASAGSFVHVPAGAVHGFRITSDAARYLILTTPRHGEFYRAISVPATASGLPAANDVDWDKVIATAREFGVEVIGDLPED
jgi:quercetin dioxygenase-like cupin family protein